MKKVINQVAKNGIILIEEQKHSNGVKQFIFDCGNGYQASVVRGGGITYGGNHGKFELAIFKDGEICYDTPITNDVLGHLTKREVEKTLLEISKL